MSKSISGKDNGGVGWLGSVKPLPPEKLDPPLVLPFSKFIEGDYQEGRHNLYIVWRGKQALYIGISQHNIWVRWFQRNGSHMRFMQKYSGTREGGRWVGDTAIGRVIETNFPKSLRWKIELRHYGIYTGDNVKRAEQRLIQELRPIFNDTYRQSLNEKERQLMDKLKPW